MHRFRPPTAAAASRSGVGIAAATLMSMSTVMPTSTVMSASTVVAATAAAQVLPAAERPGGDSVGVLLVAHGANAEWNARVDSLAAAVRRGGSVRGPVAVSYLMGEAAARTRFQEQLAVLRAAGARRVVVVPVLASSHSGHYEQVRYLAGQTDSLDHAMRHHLHAAGIERPESVAGLTLARALDGSPELVRVLGDRARSIAPDTRGRAVLILGHGPNSAEEYAAWMEPLRGVADSLRAAAGFASVTVELLRDDAPPPVRAEAVRRAREMVELQHAATGKPVVVVPLLVSSGSLTRRKVPADLAGLAIEYVGEPLLPHPAVATWVERRVREATAAPTSPD